MIDFHTIHTLASMHENIMFFNKWNAIECGKKLPEKNPLFATWFEKTLINQKLHFFVESLDFEKQIPKMKKKKL